jgi:integrase
MQDIMGQKRTSKDTKSVQEVSKQKPGRALGKTDLRYWQDSIFRPSYTRNGEAVQATNWTAKMQHEGRRESFSLGTPNKAVAAAKAREIYIFLSANGWEATLARFKPKPTTTTQTVTTVGDFLQEVTAHAGLQPKTAADYCRALRTIVAGIYAIDGGKKKYDYFGGGRDAWLKKVHAVKMGDLTPEKIQKWKIAFLRRAGADPVKQRTAKNSANSMIRQAKALFAPGVLRFVHVELPNGSPFDGVEFEARQSMRYRSSFDITKLIDTAQNGTPDGGVQKLPVEELKIFLLAMMAGLRRNEIDKLEWSAFRWEEGLIRVEATSVFHPKTEDAIGDVEVDPELLERFRQFKTKATSPFVIEASIPPRPGTAYTHYRCDKEFRRLTRWLRANGVVGNTPLHTLRKEYGSQMCAKHGIYAASHALRHADIAITSQHYVDKRRRATVGLGNLLNNAE